MPHPPRHAAPSRMTLTKTQWTAVAEMLPPSHDSDDNIGTFGTNELNSNTFIDSFNNDFDDDMGWHTG
eukprot:10886327-Heterocapsa_arctica.AAC.1